MVTLELRYIPALAELLPVPARNHAFSLMAQPWKEGTASFSGNIARFRFKTVRDAVNHCRTLAKLLRPRGISIPLAEIFPFSAICSMGKEIQADMWKIAPAGHLLVPSEADFAGASQWLYDWMIVPVSMVQPPHERITILNTLLLNGDMARECFFCGSHRHGFSNCPFMWGNHDKSVSVSDLSNLNPAYWLDYLKKAGKDRFNLPTALELLTQDMRSMFTWHFAGRVFRSTASSFSEFSSSPLVSLDVFEHREIIRAVEQGNIDDIRTGITNLENRQDRPTISIFRGFYHLASGDAEKAEENWWEAEREAATPLRKSYAALLQARIYLLQGDRLKAEAAIRRASETDQSPLATYWSMVIGAIKGDRNRTIGEFQKISTMPFFVSMALCDPLLIRYSFDIEEYFRELCKKLELTADKLAKELERVIGYCLKSFDSEIFKEAAITLRDWQGRRPAMGYSQLINAKEFLNGLFKKVTREINIQCRRTFTTFQRYDNNCRNILRRIPEKASTKKIRLGCRELISMIQESSLSGRIRHLDKLAEINREIERITSKYRQVEEMYQAYREKMWQRRMILKCILYGIILAAAAWVGIYLYEIVGQIK